MAWFACGCLAATAKAGEPGTAWKDLELDPGRLEAQAERRYAFSARPPGEGIVQRLGEIVLRSTVEKDEVVLEEQWNLEIRGEKLVMGLVHHCQRDRWLTPSKIECKGEGDEVGTFVAVVDRGMLRVVAGKFAGKGEELAFEWPEDTITISAMMRLVTLVPRETGRVYTYGHSMESGELNLKKDYRLSVLEAETLHTTGGRTECTRFELTGGGIRPMQFWVSGDGVLQRMVIDGRKFLELQ